VQKKPEVIFVMSARLFGHPVAVSPHQVSITFSGWLIFRERRSV
jgi:hypothetical protein